MTDLFVVQAAVEYHCQRYGGDLRNEEAEPHGVQPAELGKHKSAGQKQQQLAHRAHDQAEHAVAQCLEYTGKHDGHAREAKADGDDAQGGNADGEHRVRCAEQAQQRAEMCIRDSCMGAGAP